MNTPLVESRTMGHLLSNAWGDSRGLTRGRRRIEYKNEIGTNKRSREEINRFRVFEKNERNRQDGGRIQERTATAEI